MMNQIGDNCRIPRKGKKDYLIPLPEVLILSSVFGSILYSLFLFFLMAKPLTGIFIGLWAPTLMGIVNYINIKFRN